MKLNIRSKIFVGFLLLFIYIPITSLVIFSFNDSKSVIQFTGFSLEWYVKLFESDQIMRAVFTTIFVAVVSTVISTIVGTLGAIMLSKNRKWLKEWTLNLNNIPIVNPEIVTAIGFFVLFGAFSVTRGLSTMLIAHIAFSVPYVVITVFPKVRTMDPNLVAAANDLGATPFQTLWHVILPQIKVGVIAGAAIAFTMSFDDFVISYFASSGSAVQNISIYLYTLKRGLEPTINALSAMIVLVIGLKITYDYFKKDTLSKEEDE
jgi:spermidine/putrescine transport system permease protein